MKKLAIILVSALFVNVGVFGQCNVQNSTTVKDTLTIVINQFISGSKLYLTEDERCEIESKKKKVRINNKEYKKADAKKILEKDKKNRDKIIRDFNIDKIEFENEKLENFIVVKASSFVIGTCAFQDTASSHLAFDTKYEKLPKLYAFGEQFKCNYERDNYHANYSIEDNFSLLLETENEASFTQYINNRLQEYFKLDKEKKKRFNLIAGTFENRLSDVFESNNEQNFQYLLYLWEKYAKKDEKLAENPRYIKTFKGLCYKDKSYVQEKTGNQLENYLKGEGIFPFFSYDINSELKWTFLSEKSVEYTTYNYFLLKSSIDYGTIPSPQDIKNKWESHKNNCNIEGNETVITINKPVEYNLWFGPVADDSIKSILPKILIDENYTTAQLGDSIKRYVEIERKDANIQRSGCYFKIPIKVSIKPDYFRAANQNQEIELSFKIKYKDSIENVGFLERTYKGQKLKVETTNILTSDGESDNIPPKSSAITGQTNKFTYKYERKLELSGSEEIDEKEDITVNVDKANTNANDTAFAEFVNGKCSVSKAGNKKLQLTIVFESFKNEMENFFESDNDERIVKFKFTFNTKNHSGIVRYVDLKFKPDKLWTTKPTDNDVVDFLKTVIKEKFHNKNIDSCRINTAECMIYLYDNDTICSSFEIKDDSQIFNKPENTQSYVFKEDKNFKDKEFLNGCSAIMAKKIIKYLGILKEICKRTE